MKVTIAIAVVSVLLTATMFAQARPEPAQAQQPPQQRGAVPGQAKVPGQNLNATVNPSVNPPVNGHSVTLTCTASTSTGVTGYYCYSGPTSGHESTTALNSSLAATCTWIDGTVIGTNTYWYIAKAFCPACTTQLSVASNEIGPVVIPADGQPNPPTGLATGLITMNNVPLFWLAPASQNGYTVQSYQIFRGPNPLLPGPPKIATVASNQLFYTDTKGCGAKKTCYYDVKALDKFQGKNTVSVPSNIIKVTMP